MSGVAQRRRWSSLTPDSGGSKFPARVALLAVLAVCAPTLSSCAGQDEPSADAIEQRIDRERAEAARLARQDERIKQLEREVKAARGAGKATPSSKPSGSGTSTNGTASAGVPSPSSDGWPGGAAHTVILASLPSAAEAEAKQRTASEDGIDAGVLRSSDYGTLRPGFWVVFSGTFTGESSAAGHRERVRALGYRDAYVRFVAP